MCTFCSDLTLTQRNSTSKRPPITLFLKPNDPNNENEKYRFRILNFRSPTKNDRSTSFITRYVHNHWTTNDEGKKIVDETVVCPMTQYVDSKNDPSLGFEDVYRELKLKDKKATIDNVCPVCKHGAEAWNVAKASGYKDKVSMQRINDLKRQFQGIVPVYVIKDPVNEKNNGRFKCIVFSNQDEFKQFTSLVNMEYAKIQSARASGGQAYDWCNGTNAVDFYLRMDNVPEVVNQGKPNERVIQRRKITKMAFGSKAYDLVDDNGNPIITKEAIDNFEFDDQFYVKSTFSELSEFYKKNFSVVSKNIPTEEDDVFGNTSTVTAAPAPKVKIPQNPNSKVQVPVESALVNDPLVDDPDDIPFSGNTPEDDKPNVPIKADNQDIDDLMKQLDFND